MAIGNLKKVAKGMVRAISGILVKLRILPKMYIIKMDGGICSQMHFYLVGKILSQKSGSRVAFDIDWFQTDGKDCDNRFSRNFDILRMFPTLTFDTIPSGIIRRLYISSFYHKNDYFSADANFSDWMNLPAPRYFDGYFRDYDEMYTREFRKIFQIDTSLLPEDNTSVLNDIRNGNLKGDTCAVHIRRGDLSVYRPGYGHPTTVEYFIHNIQDISKRYSNTKFYLFSDEPEWVMSELMPHLKGIDATICDINGSDRGYCDLILMSRCHHIISSQGSMGKYAALLREDRYLDGEVVLPTHEGKEDWEMRFDRIRRQALTGIG